MNILLHLCCANCAIFPAQTLRAEGHQLQGYFFNPNIHPYREFRLRLEAVEQYARSCALPVEIDEAYPLEGFLAQVAPNPGQRCYYCYRCRLEQTALKAAREGFDAFSTTLLYSRRQRHELIRAEGEAVAERCGIPFLYRDFRTGWQEGIEISRAMGLYRQNYCGCIYSEKERFAPRPQNPR